MNKNLFGSFGEYIKGNAVIIILALCVVGAAAVSIYTIGDINNKLDNQEIKNPNSNIAPPDSAQIVEKKEENVPINTPAPSSEQQSKPKDKDKNSSSGANVDNPEAGNPTSVSPPAFILPVDGEIYASYSGNELVLNNTLGDWRTHNGIDIRVNKDIAVKASMSGTVTNVYVDGMLGNVVEVESENVTIRYCGLGDNIMVKTGSKISQGENIGVVGDIPLETADESHLHIEFLKNGEYQDPNKYLSGAN